MTATRPGFKAKVDFARTAADYAAFRAGFPDDFFERIAAEVGGFDGRRIVDLATGTGTLARGFAARGARATGVDRSAEMLAEAARQPHGGAVRWVAAPAEDTGLPSAGFDGVSVGTAWHWFDEPRAFAEVLRLLAPGGWLLICHLDWDELPGSPVAASAALIRARNPSWARKGPGFGFDPMVAERAVAAGFVDGRGDAYDLTLPYSHAAWRGRIRASAGVSASLSPAAVDAFDAAHRDLLATRFPAEPMAVPHRIGWYLGRKPGGAP